MPVEAVEVADGRARALRTAGGQRIAFDVIVLNPDLPVAYRDLLPPDSTPRRVKRLRYSPSCVVVHLGLDQRLRGAAHHNIHFARGYEDSFADLLAGRMQRDPSWFLTVPTCSDAEMAPPGGEVAFALLPVPNLYGDRIDWDARVEQELAETAKRMEAVGYGPVREAVVASQVVTPADWARLGMAAGTPFAASHHFFQTGPFRPANVAPKVGGVVPDQARRQGSVCRWCSSPASSQPSGCWYSSRRQHDRCPASLDTSSSPFPAALRVLVPQRLPAPGAIRTDCHAKP